jgi:riboflavin kinase, archaea type
MLKGVVKSGVGEGAFFMSMEPYAEGMEEALGYPPFKGTLNIAVKKEEAERFIANLQKHLVPGFKKGTKTFGAVKCYPCLLQDIEVAIIVPEFTRYDLSTVELIAEQHLRTLLKLKDGDKVTIDTP